MNENWFNKLFQTRLKFFIVVPIVALYLLTLVKVTLKTDDDYIGEQVYWLQEVGHVKSELMRGYNNIGLENYQAIFHKLFIYNGAIFSNVFGWSLTTLHFASLFYVIVFFGALYWYLKRKDAFFPKGTFPLVVVLMLSLSVFSEYSASFRPEVMVMALGFISYLFLDLYFRNNKLIYIILSAVFAGATFLTHLNGLIFVAAGVLLLAYKKKLSTSILFGTISSIVFSLYFADIFINSNFANFLYQFRHDPSLSEDNFKWWTPFLKVLNEQMRFLNSPKEIGFTILLVISLFYLKKLKKLENNLLIYTLLLVVIFALYTYSKTTKYLIIYLPFLALIVANGWQTIEEGNGKALTRNIFRLFLVIYISLGVFYTTVRIVRYAKSENLVESNAQLASCIPSNHKQLNVLAPGSFIFNQIDSFNGIMNMLRFTFFVETHGKPPLNFSQVVDSSKKYNIHYIIFDQQNCSYFNTNKEIKSNDARYSVQKSNEKFTIIKIAL